MATWALLLLAAMLLGNPGLVISRLSPEYYDLVTAHLGDKEQSCPCLAQEGPQGDLFTKTQKLGFRCKTCLRMIQTLKDMVKEPTKVLSESSRPVLWKKHRLLSSDPGNLSRLRWLLLPRFRIPSPVSLSRLPLLPSTLRRIKCQARF
ncbi:granulysin isoform X2 [Aotus nancymaae]|uniref:granulysin isoform X2 n=1 Tax=Aotus nancymaae TaxID=37293 RepID=UPI0030FE97CE